ncbi:MAG: dethiobiotin synthase [Candidatus Obscuribacterales bacterium]|nr:dethiobiotin synthase [Candidatus Obscuribacterales bacterium]
MKKLPDRFFITGTDTDIGKTFVSAVLSLGLNSAYWKPVQAGTVPSTDSEWVQKITELDPSLIVPETYKLASPLSPHLAAKIDGISINLADFPSPDSTGKTKLIVEGAGGIMVPLNERETMIDLMRQLDLPILVVAKSGLGTINHTVLTIEALRQRGLSILGVIMNGPLNEENKKAIEHYAQTTVLAQIPLLTELNRATLLAAFNTYCKEIS